jgi:hypothetical protein
MNHARTCDTAQLAATFVPSPGSVDPDEGGTAMTEQVWAMTDMPGPRVNARPLSLRVTPPILPPGHDAFVHVRIDPDVRNRSLEIEWRAATGGRGWHVFLIDGDHGATRYQHAIRNLGPGQYEIAATLTRIDGTSIRRSSTVTVLAQR